MTMRLKPPPPPLKSTPERVHFSSVFFFFLATFQLNDGITLFTLLMEYILNKAHFHLGEKMLVNKKCRLLGTDNPRVTQQRNVN